MSWFRKFRKKKAEEEHPHEFTQYHLPGKDYLKIDPNFVDVLQNVRDQIGSLNANIKNASRSSSKLARAYNRIALGGVIIALFSLWFLYQQTSTLRDDFLTRNRPYLTFARLDDSVLVAPFSLKEIEDAGGKIETSGFRLQNKLINSGDVPARYYFTLKSTHPFEATEWQSIYPESGVIFPNQEVDVAWFLQFPIDQFKVWASTQDGQPEPLQEIYLKVEYTELENEDNVYGTKLHGRLGLPEDISEAEKWIYRTVWSILSAD
ncbi:MAG TPA: hypothetical protein VJB56_01965 [Candidatus Paceibacterota bacterium]